MRARYLFAAIALLGLTAPAEAQELKVGRNKDIIYGRRDGHALTMDVVVPKESNGRGVILCVSGGFESRPEYLGAAHAFVVPHFTNRGYTVFAVMHSNQPRYTVPEIVEDIHLAVRFIKAQARAGAYKVDPDKLGIGGMSSGGHLSLMMGCACVPAKPNADDPVERESSRVAAVACFFPPTDFVQLDRDELPVQQQPFRTLFDVRKLNPRTNKLERVTDAERREIGRLCSPVYCAKDKKDAAPTYILHGSLDDLVPLHQSTMLHDLMSECGAVCKLDVEPIGHWPEKTLPYLPRLVKWFDDHLLDAQPPVKK